MLGIVALVKGIGALILSLIPCFGMFAIVAAGLALTLAIASILIARSGRQGMGFPVACMNTGKMAGVPTLATLCWLATPGYGRPAAESHDPAGCYAANSRPPLSSSAGFIAVRSIPG